MRRNSVFASVELRAFGSLKAGCPIALVLSVVRVLCWCSQHQFAVGGERCKEGRRALDRVL